MRIAVVDIGTNSTRLLIADVDAATGHVVERDRRATVTRLGQGVDATGRLADEAMERVYVVLTEYREAIDADGCERTTAVLTSAARDAANGPEFTQTVAERFGLHARTISGDEEAQLSFTGATGERDADAAWPVVVIDIGGGSTEFVVGDRETVRFHVSTQAGAVRHGERHIHADPPRGEELQAAEQDIRGVFAAGVPEGVRDDVRAGIAVAGTATTLAAIALELEPYDPTLVHGYRLARGTVEELLARLAQMTVQERKAVKGLHPDRAITIVPGCLLMLEAMRLFDLADVEVSEHDILRGAALQAARA